MGMRLWVGYHAKASLQAQPDRLPLPLPGFLWYGHRMLQPVEGLAHAAE